MDGARKMVTNPVGGKVVGCAQDDIERISHFFGVGDLERLDPGGQLVLEDLALEEPVGGLPGFRPARRESLEFSAHDLGLK